jgi:hypothetical protein
MSADEGITVEEALELVGLLSKSAERRMARQQLVLVCLRERAYQQRGHWTDNERAILAMEVEAQQTDHH